MTPMEHLLDTMTHKRYILEVGQKMVNYLVENGREDEAISLAKRLIIHDDSKIGKDEISNFIKIENKENMENPNIIPDDKVKESIEMHWKNNRHHPEHFKDYHDMNEVDIIEMVCDWYSRSLQYGTDFLNFVETRQNNRFHFDEKFYEKVFNYCKIISSQK